ncbi:MAG TPA: SGNH/GDSL hydrolase family protein [Armatimonadota bacterium]|jgi:lysophospholipase L1-like esterase
MTRQMKWWRCGALALMLALLGGLALAQGQNIPLAKGQLVAFLGDSITQQNLYTRYVELLLNARYPDLNLRFVNVGWSGRHAAHVIDDAVLQRDLYRLKPDIVLVLFGMNDGWYRAPSSPAAMGAYMLNMETLVGKLQAALPATQVVLLTPTPCDPVATNYLKGYNETLGQMAQYVSELAARRNLSLIDLLKPMLQADAGARATDGGFNMFIDGVHPNPIGHWIIATLISRAFGAGPGLVVRAGVDAKTLTVTLQQQTTISEVRMQDDTLLFTQTLPSVPVSLPLEARAALYVPMVQAARDKALLAVGNLPADKLYGVYQRDRFLGRYSANELAAGIEWSNPRREDPLTEAVLAFAMTKYQYRWADWRAPGTGLAEIEPAVAKSEGWKAFDAALTRLTQDADAEEHRTLLAARVLPWRIVPETPLNLEKWEVNGPYNYRTFAASYPPESDAAEGNWTAQAAPKGFLDFFPTYGQYRNSVLFARARIYVPRTAQLSVSAGSDGSVKVWVNTTLVLARDTFRTAQPEQDSGVATLQPGWNTILARENRGIQGWGLYLNAYLSGLTPEELKSVRTGPE